MSTRLQLAELTYAEAEALRDAGPALVPLLPVGAVEPHGPHAPLGTDTIISTELCHRAAEALATDGSVRAVVLPALAYGVTRFSQGFGGSVSISPELLEATVVEICGGLGEQGFARVVIVNSHFEPDHVAALQRAAERAPATLLDLTRRRLAEQLTDEFRGGAAHAGRYEGSLVLAARPELMRVEEMRRLPALPVDMPAEMSAGKRHFTEMGMHQAYCGWPADATAAEGEQTFVTLTRLLVELIREQAQR